MPAWELANQVLRLLWPGPTTDTSRRVATLRPCTTAGTPLHRFALSTSPGRKLVDAVLAILRSGPAATTNTRRVDAPRVCGNRAFFASPLGKLVDAVLAILRSGLAATTDTRRVHASRACVLANLRRGAPNYVQPEGASHVPKMRRAQQLGLACVCKYGCWSTKRNTYTLWVWSPTQQCLAMLPMCILHTTSRDLLVIAIHKIQTSARRKHVTFSNASIPNAS